MIQAREKLHSIKPKQARAAHAHTDEDRLDYLLDVAAELFLEKGFEGTSVGEIANRAKASKGTFYSRYPTKEDLFRQVIQRRTDAAFSDFDSILLPDADPAEALKALGVALLDTMLTKNSIDVLRLVYMESHRFPELGQIVYELGPGRIYAHLTKYFKQQVKKGAFIKRDEVIAAEQFLDLLSGALVRRCSLGITSMPSKAERRRRLMAAIETFLRAYQADPQSRKR